jgi:hypothetical protein
MLNHRSEVGGQTLFQNNELLDTVCMGLVGASRARVK